jgi:hypothetical protein
MSNRKYFTPDQKVAIVRRHLLEKNELRHPFFELAVRRRKPVSNRE